MESRKKLKDEQMRSILFEYYESKGKRLRFFEEFCFGRKTRADALLVTEEEMGAIKYTYEDFLKDHPDITHPDYTEDEVKMELLKATINVVLSITRGVRRDYV